MAKDTPASIFTPDVGGINDPVSADGGGLVRAAATEAQGKLALAQSNAKALEVAGTLGIEAYKGKLLADAERDIKDSLNKLEGYSPSAIEATKRLNYLQGKEFAANASIQLETLAQQTKEFDNDPTVRDFLTTIGRYKAAESQKVLSKQDVLNRIAATVKTYTAMMPGWASEFRKAAAELTGISNIDILGVHNALTQESAADKRNELMLKKRIDFVAEVGQRFGVSPEKVTPAMEQQHYQDKQIAVFKENAENKLKIAEATDKDKERYFGEYVAAVQMEGISKIGAAFSEFRKANAGVDITSKDAQTQIGGQVLGYLNDIESVIVRDIQSKTQRSADNPYPMTYDQAEKYIKSTKEFLKTYKDNLASEGGWNAFILSVQSGEGNYQRMLNNLMVTYPYVSVMAKTGVLPEIAKLYLVLGGNMEKMEASVGKPASQAIQKFLSNPFGANFLSSVQVFPSAEAAAEVVGPEQVKIGWLDVNRTIDEYAKKTELTDGERTNLVNKLTAYSNWFSATDAKAMDEFKKKVNSGEFVKLASMMTAQEKQKAFTPFFRKAEIAAKQLLPRIAQFSNEAAADVTFDPNTGMFAAKFRHGATFVDSIGGSPRIELEKQIANINSIGSLMSELSDEVFPGEKVPSIPIDMASLYGKILEGRLTDLETKKIAAEEQLAAEKAAPNRGVFVTALRIKEIESQINSTRKSITAIGAVQSKALKSEGNPEGKDLEAPAFNAISPWRNIVSEKRFGEKEMRGEIKGDVSLSAPEGLIQSTMQGPRPASALEAARNLNAIINEATIAINSKTGAEGKRQAVLDRIEAQKLLLDALGAMTEEEKDEYYGPGRSR